MEARRATATSRRAGHVATADDVLGALEKPLNDGAGAQSEEEETWTSRVAYMTPVSDSAGAVVGW